MSAPLVHPCRRCGAAPRLTSEPDHVAGGRWYYAECARTRECAGSAEAGHTPAVALAAWNEAQRPDATIAALFDAPTTEARHA